MDLAAEDRRARRAWAQAVCDLVVEEDVGAEPAAEERRDPRAIDEAEDKRYIRSFVTA